MYDDSMIILLNDMDLYIEWTNFKISFKNRFQNDCVSSKEYWYIIQIIKISHII